MVNLKDILVDLDPDEEDNVIIEHLDELQQQIKDIKLKEGPKGKDGLDGKDGKDGKDGLDGLDGRNGKDGIDGKDGKDGAKGDKGDDGKSVELKDVLDDLKLEVSKRIHVQGGGNANRNISVNGNQSVLGRYTDINLIPAGSTTITYVNNDTSKQTDITISSSGGGGGSSAWGSITGTLSNQTDLQNALNAKEAAGIDLRLDQTTPQSVYGGYPVALTGWQFASVASAPSAPAAGNLLFYAEGTQGNTRPAYQDDDGLEIIVGRDNFVIAKNTSGSTINKGQAVYVTGSTGNVPNVSLAKSDSTSTLPSIGLAMSSILNNAFGYIQFSGVLASLDTSALTSGNTLYVSATTAGALTATRPISPLFAQRMATVLVSGVGNGSVDVVTAPFVGGLESGTISSVFTINSVNAVTVSDTQTLTNKKITKRDDGTQTGVTTITPNSDNYDGLSATCTAAGGTLTIAADAGTGQTEKQSFLMEITCTNVQTFSWNTQYVGGTTALPTSTTGGGKVDYYSFVWDHGTTKWRFTGSALGF